MSAANARSSDLPSRRRVALLVNYLLLILVAEFILLFAASTEDDLLATSLAVTGELVDLSLVLVLPFHASMILPKDGRLGRFLGALTLVPLLRVVTISTPVGPLTTIQWLAVVSAPLLLASAAAMYALGLRPRDVFMGPGKRVWIPVNVALGVSGFALGYLEYQVLLPRPMAWVQTQDPGEFLPAAVVVFLATGLAEELIFRGILLRTGSDLLGPRGALFYVTGVFVVLHIGFLSIPELLLVLFLGLLFGLVVLVTRSLWGAVAAHTIANIALYLIVPFGL